MRFVFVVIMVLLSHAAAAQTDTEDAAQVTRLARVTATQVLPDGVEVHDGPAWLRVTALTDDILRVQASPGGAAAPADPWAVLPEWRARAVAVRAQDITTPGFATRSLRVAIDRTPLRLTVSDLDGHVLSQDAPDRPVVFRNAGFEVWKRLPADEAIFGLGDKPGPMNRRGRAFVNWNTDAYRWQEATDPLYKTVPFLLALRRGTAYGLFLDNTWRSHFDIGVTGREMMGFGAEGGALDYYFLAGPHPRQVLANYTALTGRMTLPPLWSLGFQQSRWSYDSAARVLDVAATYRAKRIPLDAIWLDIGYQDRNRPFTVDRTKFPDLPGMVRTLGASGIRVVAITDLHIADAPDAGYAPYDSGIAGDHFVRTAANEAAAGDERYVGKVWPGPAVFPDFSRAATRAWWGGLYRDFYLRTGIAGFWNDMNEPSVFDGPGKTMPLDVRHRIEEPGLSPRTASHREIHNAYGMLNARATADGLRSLAPDRRSFVLTRATFAGGQRDAAVWTGDNSSTWNHLRISTPQLLSLGLSGFALCGADIGGFAGSPTPDLLTRWLQVGAFNPLFRDHTETGTRDQEAYAGDDAQVGIRRNAIAARYRLMPYLYTAIEEAARTGTPVMRPLFLEYPGAGLEWVDNEFLFGRDLLVAPPPEDRPDGFQVVVPPATAWFDYWTGHPFGGGQVVPAADTIPVLARAGAIIPHQPLTQSTAETPSGNLELRVYPGPACSGSLYTDDGVTLAYRRGAFRRQQFSCRADEAGLHLTVAPAEGSYPAWWRGIDVVLFGQSAPPRAVRDGATTIPARYDPADASVRFTLAERATGSSVLVVH